MDSVGPQFECECGVHAALTFDTRQSRKCLGHDPDVEVRLAARSRAGVTRMLAALIFDHKFYRSEGGR